MTSPINTCFAIFALIAPLSLPANALGIDVNVGIGGGANVGVDVSLGGSDGGSGGASVGVGIGGDGGTPIATGYGAGGGTPVTTGINIGTDTAGVDPNLLPQISNEIVNAIIGTSVWTNDQVLVGMVTGIERQLDDTVLVRVQAADDFGAPYNSLRFNAAMRAFANHQLKLPQSKAQLMELLS